MTVKRLPKAKFPELLAAHRSGDILDIRPISQFMAGFIPFSINLPGDEPNFLANLRKVWPMPGDVVLVLDNSPIPKDILAFITDHGGTVTGHLSFDEWHQAGYPVLTLESTQAGELSQPSDTLIDVRTPAEWDIKHIATSHNLPLAELQTKIVQLSRSHSYVVYCAGIYRGLNGAATLHSMGFNVRYLANGLDVLLQKN